MFQKQTVHTASSVPFRINNGYNAIPFIIIAITTQIPLLKPNTANYKTNPTLNYCIFVSSQPVVH